MKSISFLLMLALVSLSACKTNSPQTTVVENSQSIPIPAPQPPKNIILLIGDGMGVSQIYGGMVANKNILELERMQHIGFIKTYSSDNLITDSGAGATAFSIGEKTYNGAIGVASDTSVHETVLESAALAGKATGMVVTSTITHATPASFAAHVPSRNMHEEIAWQLVESKVDLLIGGGRKYFNQRKDGRDLLAEMMMRGFFVVDNEQALLELQPDARVGALLWEDAAPKKTEGRDDILARATGIAIDRLSTLKDAGFFLLVEGSQIDWGGHANDTRYIVEEMMDFDRSLAVALDFAEKDGETLVIVTADHETGGFSINGGDFKTGEVTGAFTTGGHTAVMVPVFAFGPVAENFMGIQENVDIYRHMMNLLGLKAGHAPRPYLPAVRK